MFCGEPLTFLADVCAALADSIADTDAGDRERDELTAVYAEVVCAWSGSRHYLLNNMVTHRLPLHPEVGELLGNFASLYPLEVDWRRPGPFRRRRRRSRAAQARPLTSSSV